MHPAIRFLLRGLAALAVLISMAWLLAGCGGGECDAACAASDAAEAAAAAQAAQVASRAVPTPQVNCSAVPGQCI